MNTQTTRFPEHGDIRAISAGLAIVNTIKKLASKNMAKTNTEKQTRTDRKMFAKMSPRLLRDIGVDARLSRPEDNRNFFHLTPSQR